MNPLIITAASFAFSTKCKDLHRMIHMTGHFSDVLSEDMDDRVFHRYGVSGCENCDPVIWGNACQRGPYYTLLSSGLILLIGYMAGSRFNAGAFNLYPLFKEIGCIFRSFTQIDLKDNDYSHVYYYLGFESYIVLISSVFIITLWNLHLTLQYPGAF
jgi:hypothetical protein